MLYEDFEDALGGNWTEGTGARENTNAQEGSWCFDGDAGDNIELSNDGDFPTVIELQTTFYVKPATVIGSGNYHTVEHLWGDNNTAPGDPHMYFTYHGRHSDEGGDQYTLTLSDSVWDGVGNNEYIFQSGTLTRTGVNIWESSASYVGFRIKINKNVDDKYTMSFYTDENNDGTFSLVHVLVSSSGTPPTYDDEFVFVLDNGNGDNIYLDTITVDDLTNAGEPVEIATLIDCVTHNERDIGGYFSAKTLDAALTNYSTIYGYLNQQIEIWDDDLTEVIWEGWLTDMTFKYNHVLLAGINAPRLLEDVDADYNGILAAGEVTSLTADTIDDSAANFPATLVTKLCTFTDEAGPANETDYPGANSATYESDKATPLAVTMSGLYTDLATEEGNWAGWIDHDQWFMYLEYTIANAATSTALNFDITCAWRKNDDTQYTGLPAILIYDVDAGDWVTLGSNITPPAASVVTTYSYTDADLAKAIDKYFNGTTLKLGIKSGQYASGADTVEMIKAHYAPVKNTYAAVFPASTIYTIDARDSNTLTFTGQSTTGLGVGDRYRVGDYCHNVASEIWDRLLGIYLSLTYDTSTKFDATDYSATSVVSALRMMASLDGRHIYHQKGWNIVCPSSLPDTGIDLTEANIELEDIQAFEGWTYKIDGRNIRRRAKVFGAGIYAEDSQVPTYETPMSIVTTDSRIASQHQADVLVTQLLSDHANEGKIMTFVVNYSRLTNSSNIDVGKTIDISLHSGAITATAAEIISTEFKQFRGGDVFCRMVLEC